MTLLLPVTGLAMIGSNGVLTILSFLQQVGNVTQNSRQQTQTIVGTPGTPVNSQTGVSQQALVQVQQPTLTQPLQHTQQPNTQQQQQQQQ